MIQATAKRKKENKMKKLCPHLKLKSQCKICIRDYSREHYAKAGPKAKRADYIKKYRAAKRLKAQSIATPPPPPSSHTIDNLLSQIDKQRQIASTHEEISTRLCSLVRKITAHCHHALEGLGADYIELTENTRINLERRRIEMKEKNSDDYDYNGIIGPYTCAEHIIYNCDEMLPILKSIPFALQRVLIRLEIENQKKITVLSALNEFLLTPEKKKMTKIKAKRIGFIDSKNKRHTIETNLKWSDLIERLWQEYGTISIEKIK